MASSSQTTNRRQVALLALTLGVVMLGFGIVIPVYPFYIQSMGASGKELGLLITIAFFILPNAMLRVTVVSLTSQRAEMGQGAAMGLSNSFTSLGRIVGPVWAGFSYDVDAAYPFWSGAAAMLLGLWSAWCGCGRSNRRTKLHRRFIPTAVACNASGGNNHACHRTVLSEAVDSVGDHGNIHAGGHPGSWRLRQQRYPLRPRLRPRQRQRRRQRRRQVLPR